MSPTAARSTLVMPACNAALTRERPLPEIPPDPLDPTLPRRQGPPLPDPSADADVCFSAAQILIQKPVALSYRRRGPEPRRCSGVAQW